MWKNSLKNVESENNKILYGTLRNFFLQRKGTYFLNKPLILNRAGSVWGKVAGTCKCGNVHSGSIKC